MLQTDFGHACDAVGVPNDARMKLLFKGQLKDGQTLREAGLTNGSKVMVLGSTVAEMRSVQEAAASSAPESTDQGAGQSTEPSWSEQPQHKKIIDKGRPKNAWPGIKDRQMPLTDQRTMIPGLCTAHGPVRLTFKDNLNQVWIGSATRTQKVTKTTITKIEAQPIVGHEEYSILRLQLGRQSESTAAAATGCCSSCLLTRPACATCRKLQLLDTLVP